MSTTDDHGILSKVYPDVYYSKESDAPDHAKEYAGILFRIRGGTGLSALDEWNGEGNAGLSERNKGPLRLRRAVETGGWEYDRCPPSRREVRRWLLENPIQTGTVERKAARASQVRD